MSNQTISEKLVQLTATNNVTLAPYHFSNLEGIPGNNYKISISNNDVAYPASVKVLNGNDTNLVPQSIPAGGNYSVQITPLNPTGRIQVTNISDEPVAGRPSVTFNMTPA